eukprot:1428648-Rhodomonas_salina.2
MVVSLRTTPGSARRGPSASFSGGTGSSPSPTPRTRGPSFPRNPPQTQNPTRGFGPHHHHHSPPPSRNPPPRLPCSLADVT